MKREGEEGEEEEGEEEEGEEGGSLAGTVSQPLVEVGGEGGRGGGEGEDSRPLWEGRSTKLLQGSQKKVSYRMRMIMIIIMNGY